MTSFFTTDITTFPAIRLKISLMPIGLKPGVLFSGIKRHAVKASNDCLLSLLTSICSAHNFLMNFATAFRKLDAQLPNEFETKIRRQPSVSRPDGQNHPLFPLLLSLRALRQCHRIQLDQLAE